MRIKVKPAHYHSVTKTKYQWSSNYSRGQPAVFSLVFSWFFYAVSLICLWCWAAFFSVHHSKTTFISVIKQRLYMARWKEGIWTGLITPKEPSVDCVNMGILLPEAVLETWMHPNGSTAFKCEITWCNLAQYALPQVPTCFHNLRFYISQELVWCIVLS